MADTYTQVSTLSTLVTTAYDKMIENKNRAKVLFRGIVDKYLADPSHAGSSYTLQLYNDLVESSAALTEITEPDAVAPPALDTVNIAFAEFGRLVVRSFKLDATSLASVDPMILDILARDRAVSLDNEIKAIANAGTNVFYGGTATSTVTVTAAMVIDSDDVRAIRTFLVRKSADTVEGDLYQALVHPNQSYDLRRESGTGGWQDLHKYAAPDVFWPGVIGVYEGVFFQESPRVKVANDGAASATVYRALFRGRQALAEVVWKEPSTVIAEPGTVDKLSRHRGFGWHGALNWGRYREDNLVRLETGSSIANT